MTIRYRILALLALLSLICIGIFLLFRRVQESEEAFVRQQREHDLAVRLQRLVSSTARPAYRYLRNYVGRAAMIEFLTKRDPAWAEKNLKGRLDAYRLDAVWVLGPDGTLIYGLDRPTDALLNAPPLPAGELQPLLEKAAAFSCHEFMGDRLFQLQGMPIFASADLDRRTPPLGWLVVAKYWGGPVLEDMADSGQGRIMLTGTTHVSDVRSEQELEAWQPLQDHRGRVVAGLDYHVMDALIDDASYENFEIALLLLNSVGALVLVAVLMHYWILRPFTIVSSSLVTGDQAALAPLLAQRSEFGQMARVVQSSVRDREQLQRSLEERVRLGRELHDDAIQGVYGAGMALSRVKSLMGQDHVAAHRLLDETRDELNRIIHDLRRHIEKADPKPLDISFAEAVARLIEQLRGPGTVATRLNIDEALVASHPPLNRSHVLQFVREAVSNALRHGHPLRVAVSWQRTPEGSAVVVEDDGVGFDPGTVTSTGRGLGNLGERAVLLGGRFEIKSGAGQGTRVYLNLPPSTINS